MNADVDRPADADRARRRVGLLLFVPLSAIRVVIDQNVADFDHSGWAPLFAIALFVGLRHRRVRRGADRGRRPALERHRRRRRRVPALDPDPHPDLGRSATASQGLFSGTDPVFTAGPHPRPDRVRRRVRRDRRLASRRAGAAPGSVDADD